jgi:GT2 family glycosyltransferase
MVMLTSMSENRIEKTIQPFVYIILLNWNGKEDTLECLRSLEKINYPNYRICLVDNASSDGSVAAVRSAYPDVEIIENSENLRFAEGNNVGIRHALKRGADYVLLLNNDTKVDPEFLQAMVSFADTDSAVGMVGPKIYYYDQPNLIWSAGGEICFWRGRIAHRGLRQKNSEKFNEIFEVDYLTGCTLLVKKEVIEKVGLLDSSYYIYTEDADWCERAKRAGFKLFFVPQAKVWHKISSTSGGGLTAYKTFHKVKSNYLFFRKYARWYHWLTIPKSVILGLIVEVFKQIFSGNFKVIFSLFRGFGSVLLGKKENAG